MTIDPTKFFTDIASHDDVKRVAVQFINDPDSGKPWGVTLEDMDGRTVGIGATLPDALAAVRAKRELGR